jgi:hypothetical protein
MKTGDGRRRSVLSGEVSVRGSYPPSRPRTLRRLTATALVRRGHCQFCPNYAIRHIDKGQSRVFNIVVDTRASLVVDTRASLIRRLRERRERKKLYA